MWLNKGRIEEINRSTGSAGMSWDGREATEEPFSAKVHSAVEPQFEEGVKDVSLWGKGSKDEYFRAISGPLYSFGCASAEFSPPFAWFEYMLNL